MSSEIEREKARAVRQMFGSIAGRYDFLNHFLSANIDQSWRRRSVQEIAARLSIERPRILDLGCGTADLSLAFSRLGPVVGCDFSHPMLTRGKAKALRGNHPFRIDLIEGDALCLPFETASFDAVVSAFVVRNLANIGLGLAEMRRVLRPDGVLGILDFAMPRSRVLGPVYRFYFSRVLPRLGSWVSGIDGPYRYLPESVQSFPPPELLCRTVQEAGFIQVEYRLLTAGIAVLHIARKGV